MANSKRKCKHCKRYLPAVDGIKTPSGFFCSITHAYEHARAKQKQAADKQVRKDLKQRREALRDRSWYLKEAQRWFNKFIRLRDAEEPCISCGRHHQGQYHAGHYRSVGAAPELRFEELNCHKQCAPCNNHKSGNITDYRINLVQKIGEEKVLWIESKHPPLKLSIEQIKGVIAEYKAKCKSATT